MGPLLRQVLFGRVRRAVRRQDSSVGLVESIQLTNTITPDMMNTAKIMAAQKLGITVEEVEQKIMEAEGAGDIPPNHQGGSFLDWLDQFLNSEIGKMLIDFLMKLLLGLI